MCDVVDWIDLAQNKDGWRVVMNAVMKLNIIQYEKCINYTNI
jgi:hypothetical protein